ncbi:hypothetical protein MTO96_038447 [Rhipicephalus appendiculatus]
MNYQQGYQQGFQQEYQPEYQSGYDAYSTAYQQSNYDAYSTATESTAEIQPQSSKVSARLRRHHRSSQQVSRRPFLSPAVQLRWPTPCLPIRTSVLRVSQVRGGKGYLPPDGMCDYLFYDSLYKNVKSSLLNGIKLMELAPQYFVYQAARYTSTEFGLSFSPE